MPAWPASLPQFVLEQGYQETLADQTVETQMDAGPAKVRRRYTAAGRMFQVTVAVSATQAATLEAFYLNDCAGGSLTFTWVHPRTRAAATFRFRKPAPSISSRGSGGELQYRLALELMP